MCNRSYTFYHLALVDVIVDDMLQQKNTPATVLVFFVFLPLHPTAFDENTRASFVLAVASVYSMSISNVQLLAVDLWPLDDMTSTTATSVSSARGTAGNNIPTTPKRRSLLTGHQSRLTVRISGTPAFTKKSTAALNVQLIIQGLPASLSGIVPQKITDSEAFPRQFILLACVAVLLMCCASCCTMCYLFTENLQTSFQFPQGVYFRAKVLVFRLRQQVKVHKTKSFCTSYLLLRNCLYTMILRSEYFAGSVEIWIFSVRSIVNKCE